jgi:serine protease Do
MHIILIHILSLFTLAAPLQSCKRESLPDHVYTVAEKIDRDSVSGTISGSRRNAITNAVAKASPAVVGINVTEVHEQQYYNFDPFGDMFGDDPFFQQFFGRRGGGGGRGGVQTRKYQVKALGSGFIISPDGYILTNDHVAGNATKIIVTTTDGSEYDAKLVGTDHTSDVSLLKIESKPNLPYLKFGNSDDVAVGEWAIAMGNPFGLFSINNKPTVTVGVISNTGVNLGVEGNRNYRDMLQTDAAISSGNSGGPLLNANGEVIGMNSVIRSTAQSQEGAGSIGLGFAIPINKITTIVDELRAGETRNHNIDMQQLGVQFQDVTDQIKEYYNLSSDAGVVVTAIMRNGVAMNAGMQAGDVITGLDKEKVKTSQELESAILDHEVGDKVTFHVQRDGKNVDVKIKLPGKEK